MKTQSPPDPKSAKPNKNLGLQQRGYAKLWLGSKVTAWLVCDFFIVLLLFYFFTKFGKNASDPVIRQENTIASVAFAILFCITGLGTGLFEAENRFSKMSVLKKGFISLGTAALLGIAILQFLFFFKVGRFALVYGSVASFTGVYFFHDIMGRILSHLPMKFVILGKESSTTRSLLNFFAPNMPRTIKHYQHSFEAREFWESHLNEIDPNDAIYVFEDQNVSELVLTEAGGQDPKLLKIAIRALQAGMRVVDETTFFGESFRRYPVDTLSASWITRAGFNVNKPITNMLKRIFDVTLSLFLLICLSPVLMLIAILIKVTSSGPIFYLQQRQGKHLSSFVMIKFRSMKHGFESFLLARDARDPRITSVGRALRPLHLDELPQLFNILRGEMSFVGPRPEAMKIAETARQQIPAFELRQMLRPGLTGLAQISQGKTSDDKHELETKLSYDLFYVNNYDLLLDAWIILKTAFTLAKRAW